MIINHKYKFVFVHIQKTAGSSITADLMKLGSNQLYEQHSFINKLDEKYKNYFKFTFVRNPWDRLVSWYNMFDRLSFKNDFIDYIKSNSTNFSEFLNCTRVINETKGLIKGDFGNYYPKSISINQLDYVSNKQGKIKVNFIGKIESLQEDYDKIKEILNLPKTKLPHINKGEKINYREYYNESDTMKVFNMYKKDINYFNYKF